MNSAHFSNPSSRRGLVCLGLVVLTLAVFAQVPQFEFTNYDDPQYVSENWQVQSGLSPAGLRWAFIDSKAVFWIPVTWLSHLLDCQFFGLDAGAHHLVNLLLHTANVALLFLLLHRLTGAQWRSAFVAACFAVHPLNVEPVAWIAERKGVLSTLFFLLALHAWLGWVAKKGAARYALALALFALGLLAKPMLVTLPLLLLVLDQWPLRRVVEKSWPALLREKAPFFALSLAMAAATVFFASRAEVWVSAEQVAPAQRFLNALNFVGVYLWKCVAPVNLAVFYPFARSGAALPAAGVALLALAVTWLAWRQRVRAPWLLAGWTWYLLALLPVLRVLQVGAHAVADRYVYVPLIGIFVLIAWGTGAAAERWTIPPRLLGVVAGAVLAGLAALSWVQSSVWRNSITLFSHAIEVTPENPVARINLGAALEHAGRADDALPHYIAALRLDPTRAQAHFNLANILDARGDFAGALPHFEEAIRLRPREPRPRLGFGQALTGQRRFDEARAQYAEAMRLSPGDPQPHYLAGVASMKQGRLTDAVQHLRAALGLNPNHAKALDRLARVLACALDSPPRDGAEAVRLATRAAELTAWQQPAALDTLAMAHAETGRFDEAVKMEQRAMDLFTAAGAIDEAKKLEPRLRQFQNRQPWRENFSESGER